MSDDKDCQKEEAHGVVLYYKYTSIPNLDELVTFYESNCTSLGLLGRVRVAPHGVNVTIGGKLGAVEEHINAVKCNSLFEGTDFKLASCHQPLDDRVAKECGFTSLSVRVVKELVTFSSHPLLRSPEIENAGKHLSAVQFHSVLRDAAQLVDKESPADTKGIVLLDARNLYETRIGKFHAPNVETLDPGIRQYSDLPTWIDDNSEQLRGKHILMYCTGGIRCEMASAYIRSKGAGFENVFQLYGGIQRYLEQFPDGGFFRGKNFVFDHRISVGSSDPSVLGTCILCGLSFDDYSPRCRCVHCRMLVLVCNDCQVVSDRYVCELCQKHGKGAGSIPSIDIDELQELSVGTRIKTASDAADISIQISRTNGVPRKLRILCLHGFRQNASGFKGRTASLAKKLKNIAELHFVNASHELPYIYQPYQNSVPFEKQESCPPPSENCKKRFAWLVAPGSDEDSAGGWKMANVPFDPLQYREQTEGFDASLAYLKTIFSEQGPFDGILGFSQGAAMAALVAAQQKRLKGEVDFRFVILCSGFAVNMAEVERGIINCPSLHIFGGDQGKDRQIANQASRELASLFEDGCSVIIEHDCGHVIPTRSPYIDIIKEFLGRFL